MTTLLKLLVLMLLGNLALSFCGRSFAAADKAKETPSDPLGWRLGAQAYTFNRFTFFEAVDKIASAGLKYVEAYPGQRISEDGPEKISHTMSAELRRKVQKKLNAAGVKWVCFGVTGGKDEADWRKLFEFAKAMGIETITAEPDPAHMDCVERLCEEFQINLAIHNHPKGSHSRYWNPDTVLAAVKGRNPRIGACADTGHWARSGLDPLECLKKLEGRIISLHFKDLNERSPEAHDVHWGTGACNVYALLSELKRQGFQGVFSIEYEHNWDNSLPDVKECVKYFRLAAAALDDNGYTPLFAGDLSNAILTEGGWAFEDGTLAAKGRGDIWTKKRYGDFVLDLEFKCTPETNSGVFLRCGSIDNWLHTAIEVQILQPTEENDKHNCGAIFDCLAPSKRMVKAPGEWNHYTIMAKANKIFVVLNGEQIIAMNLELWKEAHKNSDGTPNKFNFAYKDMPREGHFGLQYHGHPVFFRNLKVKPLTEVQ